MTTIIIIVKNSVPQAKKVGSWFYPGSITALLYILEESDPASLGPVHVYNMVGETSLKHFPRHDMRLVPVLYGFWKKVLKKQLGEKI